MANSVNKLQFNNSSYIGGLWHRPEQPRDFPVINPATGDSVALVKWWKGLG